MFRAVLIACCLLLPSLATAQPTPPAEAATMTAEQQRERWNRAFSDENPFYTTAPNAFLLEVLRDRPPGRALEVGLGQGRNAIALAKLGWQVTGIDISDVGIAKARKQAAALALTIDSVLADADTYEYGTEQYDLVVGMYMHQIFSRNAEKIVRALKPGGLVIVEGFHDDMSAVINRPLGHHTNELLRAFDGLRITHYQDLTAHADWGRQLDAEAPIVRFVARKPATSD